MTENVSGSLPNFQKGTKTRRYERQGFTLLELMVVISIIAVLASLLLPALARVKARSKQATCINNLGQINVAVHLYADDFGDVFPPPASDWLSNAFTHYVVLVKPYLGATEVLSNHPKIFACPADTFYHSNNPALWVKYSVHDLADADFSSYGFNAGNTPIGLLRQLRFPGIAGLKTTEVNEPSKTVLLEEVCALEGFSWHEPPLGPAAGAWPYNDAKCVLSFVDGHTSNVKIYWHAQVGLPFYYDPPPSYNYRWSANYNITLRPSVNILRHKRPLP